MLLKSSIKKYGKKYFKKEILEYCESLEELNNKEIYWINLLKSTDRKIGYNIDSGGQYLNKKTIQKRKLKRNGWSDEKTKLWKQRISETMKKRNTSKGENNPMFGVEFTDERKQKCAETKKNNKHKHKYYTEEYKNKMSIKNTGENNPNYNNKWSNEQKEKMSKHLKNNNVHKGENNSMYGKYGENNPNFIKIPDNILNNIIFDYTQNFYSIKKLSNKYNYSLEKIKTYLKHKGIKIKKIYISKENEDKIINMYIIDKMKITQISKYFSLERRNINKVLKKYNIDIVSKKI